MSNDGAAALVTFPTNSALPGAGTWWRQLHVFRMTACTCNGTVLQPHIEPSSPGAKHTQRPTSQPLNLTCPYASQQHPRQAQPALPPAETTNTCIS